jgi:hypothetical protein
VRVNEKRYLRVNVCDAEMKMFTDPERRALEKSVEVKRNEGVNEQKVIEVQKGKRRNS